MTNVPYCTEACWQTVQPEVGMIDHDDKSARVKKNIYEYEINNEF